MGKNNVSIKYIFLSTQALKLRDYFRTFAVLGMTKTTIQQIHKSKKSGIKSSNKICYSQKKVDF